MADAGKRKTVHDGDDGGATSVSKKTKGGHHGKRKWRMAHHQGWPHANAIEPGDKGMFVTCARSMKGKAVRELTMLLEEYADKMYGIKPPGEQGGSDEDDEDDGDRDIEASIVRELVALQEPADESGLVFAEVRLKEDCLLFVRCRDPVEPVAFARRICLDAAAAAAARATDAGGGVRARTGTTRTRYVNRLSPVSFFGRANLRGVDEVAARVLPGHFALKPEVLKKVEAGAGAGAEEAKSEVEGQTAPKTESAGSEVEAKKEVGGQTAPKIIESAETEAGAKKEVEAQTAPKAESAGPEAEAKKEVEGQKDTTFATYAIRPTIRNHNTLKSLDVIKRIAGMIDPRHKVNLGSPDQVILVDIYHTVLGMSVVPGDWDSLKRYNLTELGNLAVKSNKSGGDEGGKPVAANGDV